ncbi:GroES-like protein [Zopfia rhizophila CBS 207.26]|uniref:GroES-like protein n=1 Tax=Zopfia rhizophila CBS 207.26 TaxID=1314779 RepID=A0A6A6DZA8_9PEZI|nr:GroES-like protein [Zopfia rhizophila CBS 207.26]
MTVPSFDTVPSTQTAIIQNPDGCKPCVSTSHPVPRLPSSIHILVRVAAVALNPTDNKMPSYHPTPGAVMGCDFTGTIMSLGSSVSSVRPDLKTGMQVCGGVHGSNPADPTAGAFAQYIVTDARIVVRIPDSWTDEQAAALGGIGWGCLGMALWDTLGLTGTPSKPIQEVGGKKVPVLVYGGATATGTMACQLLNLSGYTPLTTASARSAPLALSYGASHSISYTSPSCGSTLRALTNTPTCQPLKHALDCITSPESAAICFEALGRTGGHYACLEAFDPAWQTRKAAKVNFVMGYEIFGKGVALEGVYGREPDERKFERYSTFALEMQDLLHRGLVRSHPLRSVDGGWNAIAKGLDILKRGDVRGGKLVVKVE